MNPHERAMSMITAAEDSVLLTELVSEVPAIQITSVLLALASIGSHYLNLAAMHINGGKDPAEIHQALALFLEGQKPNG